MSFSSIFLSLFLYGCAEHHVHDHGHGDHGHHGSDSEQVTIWTEHLEAFVEYEVLKPNKPSKMLVHLTWLEGHRPVTEGSLRVHLEGHGVHDSVEVEEPARTGIFIPTLTPSAVEDAKLWIELNSEEQTERVDLDTVTVAHPSENDHAHSHEEPSVENTISFLKEQAWKIPFQTHMVAEKPIYQTIEALGQWTVRPEDVHTISAPSSGTVVYGATVPHIGSLLESQEHTITIQSEHLFEDSVSLRWKEVEIEWQTIRREYERKKPLKDQGVLSLAQWEDIEQRYLTTKVQYDQLARKTRNGVVRVNNPVKGKVSEQLVTQGMHVKQGAPLYRLVTNSPSLLVLAIPHRHHDALRNIHSVEVQIDGVWSRIEISEVHVGLSLAEHHTIPLQVFTLPQEHVVIEEKTNVRLVFGDPKPQKVVPQEALIEEYGQYSVIQQIGGEEFVSSPVQIGARNNQMVAITSGLELGDWVVSKGNYIVKMTSESGNVPAHGYAH